MAVMEVTQGGLILQELMSPYTVEDIKNIQKRILKLALTY